MAGISIYVSLFLLANQLTNVLGDGQDFLFLQPPTHKLQTDVCAIIDLWVIYRIVSNLVLSVESSRITHSRLGFPGPCRQQA